MQWPAADLVDVQQVGHVAVEGPGVRLGRRNARGRLVLDVGDLAPHQGDAAAQLHEGGQHVALGAGLYPKILSIEPQSGTMRTLSNNQLVHFHPSSINFHRRPQDFGVNYLCFFTIMLVRR